MSFQLEDYLDKPFVLVTERLVIVPTPIAIQYDDYVQLYGSVHASEAFCQMAFGPHFVARDWSIEETRDVIFTRDMGRCWKPRGLGDLAVALRTRSDGSEVFPSNSGRKLKGEEVVNIVEDFEFNVLEGVEWVGYAGVRDATTTSMPGWEERDGPLPPWEEMIELRYGVHEKAWGKGVAGEAARAVMQWAVAEQGVRRFIAETEKTNTRSGKVLQKMGFRESGTNYWKEPSEMEWAKVAA
jgi:GNAT superfamily N-acetyltransferase